MKVVSAFMMAELESTAYEQGFKEKDFMENAGYGIAQATHDYIQNHLLPPSAPRIWLLCGKGNNGGDAFVAGVYLLEMGYRVTAIQLDPLEKCSPLCQFNRRRFIENQGELLTGTKSFESGGLILDGLFGTGFKGKVHSPHASLIDMANESQLPILAIDIPSGLDGSTGKVEGSVIHSKQTLYLGLPKTGLFLEEGWNVTGKLHRIDFGLPNATINAATEDFNLITKKQVQALLPPIKRNRHKYQAGYVVGLAGSPSMPGAGILASLAALRGGSGMVRLLYPEGMEAELSASPYELIKIPYSYDEPDKINALMEEAGATFIGPGLGRSVETHDLLKQIIPSLNKPCVIDADALTLFAQGAFLLPTHAILTPHMGEMQTLLKSSSRLILTADLLKTCQNYSEEHQVTLILKGAPTFIFHPQTPMHVNPRGDPGMATAGTGDVLTGLLAALLSQGLGCQEAAIVGVYLHGLAGELAAWERETSYGMMATDLIAQFAPAFNNLEKRYTFRANG